MTACPKCGTARAEDSAVACTKCGLAADRMAAFAASREAEVSDQLRDAWAAAEASWDDAARHDAVFQRVAADNAYAWAAARYRARGEDPIAARQLERVRRAVEATLMASAASRPDDNERPYKSLIIALVVLVVIAIAGFIYSMVVRDRAMVPTRPAARAVPTGRVPVVPTPTPQ